MTNERKAELEREQEEIDRRVDEIDKQYGVTWDGADAAVRRAAMGELRELLRRRDEVRTMLGLERLREKEEMW